MRPRGGYKEGQRGYLGLILASAALSPGATPPAATSAASPGSGLSSTCAGAAARLSPSPRLGMVPGSPATTGLHCPLRQALSQVRLLRDSARRLGHTVSPPSSASLR